MADSPNYIVFPGFLGSEKGSDVEKIISLALFLTVFGGQITFLLHTYAHLMGSVCDSVLLARVESDYVFLLS